MNEEELKKQYEEDMKQPYFKLHYTPYEVWLKMKYRQPPQLKPVTSLDKARSRIIRDLRRQLEIDRDAYYRSSALRLGNTVSSLGTPNYALENQRTLGNLKATTNAAALAAGGYGLWNAPVQTAYGIAGGIGGSILGDKIGQVAEEHLEAPEYTSDLTSFAGSMLGGYYGTKAAPEYVASLPEILTKPGETFFKMFPYKTYDYLRYRMPSIMPTLKNFFNTDLRNHPFKKAKFQWLRDQLRSQPRVDVEDVNYTRVIPELNVIDLTKSRYKYLFEHNPDIWKHYDPNYGAITLDGKPQWLSNWDNILIKQHIPLKDVYKMIRGDGHGVITSVLNTPRTYLSLNISPGFSMGDKFIKINPWYSKALGENVDDVIAHEITHNLDAGTHMMRGGDLNWVSYTHLPPKHQNYFFNKGYTELIARGTQLKNYFGLKGGEPITEDMLKYAAKHYVKDTGIDNNMTQFFSGIKDWGKAAEWLSKYSLKNGGKLKYN